MDIMADFMGPVYTRRIEIEKNALNKYMTVNEKDGAFVKYPDAKIRDFYHGISIYDQDKIKILMKKLKIQEPNLSELNIMTSETSGLFCKTGNPSDVSGEYIWIRAVLKDGVVLPWVCFDKVFFSLTFCQDTLNYIVSNARYRRAILFDKSNSDISNKRYITIDNMSSYVGDKEYKTTYYGYKLQLPYMLYAFNQIKEIDSDIQELHILSSKTSQDLFFPSSHKGRNVWWRFKTVNNISPWFFEYQTKTVSECLQLCTNAGNWIVNAVKQLKNKQY